MSGQAFDAFLFYRSYREALNGMTQKDQLATLLAIIDYALYGVEPNLKGKMPAAVFTVARPIIDSNNSRRAGGKKGGRPKKKTIGFSTEETNGFQDEKPDALYNKEMKNEEHRNKEISPLNPPKGERSARPRFIPPTVEEVREYCQERENHVDPEAFTNFYTANGWMQGKGKPIVDWKAAVRTWERRKEPGSKNDVKTAADYDGGESFV